MENTTYYNMEVSSDSNEKKKNSRLSWALGIVSVLLLGMTIFCIVYVVQNPPSSSSSSSDCTTPECVSLANEILSSIDDSVDPCVDFFQYACGNFINEYDWELVDDSSYGEFDKTSANEQEMFLDALYYDINQSLINHSSVLKARDYFEACYESELSDEDFETALLLEFITIINFSSGNNTLWDESTIEGYQYAIAWLTQRSWIDLWSLSVYDVGIPLFTQYYQFWVYYNNTAFSEKIEEIMVPLYESIFGLSEAEASQIAQNVASFANEIASITTATATYDDYTYLISVFRNSSDLSVFTSSNITNYTKLIMDVFDLSNEDAIDQVIYFTPDIQYFDNLTNVIASNTPQTVQYFLFTNVIIYVLNFGDALLQSMYVTRTDYCYEQILSAFPFIFGYISDKYMYDDETKTIITNMIESVANNGIKQGLNEASWLDEESLENSLLKIENLGIYVGLPPQITNVTALDMYYSNITIINDDYISSLESLVNFNVYIKKASFKGINIDLIYPWPSEFQDSSSYGYWLTGINAFYVATGNYFTIPITITQKIFFSKYYPSSINFGGLGSVIGHEISHGFDPDGSYYDYQGNADDIWTNETRNSYEEIVDCIISQYDGFEVSGTNVDGNLTQTEDVADNGGVSASYMAWKKWKKQYKSQSFTLPGVDLTENQLFFLGWARNWCQVYRSDYYSDWTDVHAPNPARVWGAVQNMEEFSDAFNCKTNALMNPEDKCVLWG